jgi:D-glycero-D-manno-heptose 1,7-bisphosphate phosphatase
LKFVFLDRDGVINEFPGNGNYVTKVKNFRFIPGSLEAIRNLTEAGYTIFVISNQAGVGKGVYTQNKLDRITRKLHKGVEEAHGKIKEVFYCTHRSDAECDCRKPGIGNIEKAVRSVRQPIDAAAGSYFVGDTKSDILTGFNAKLKTIFVLTGRCTKEQVKDWGIKPDYIVADLLEATRIIIRDKKMRVSPYKTKNILSRL